MLGPVAAGLWGTMGPAFGHMPVLGATGPSLEPFRTLIAWPGFQQAVIVSVLCGFVTTMVSLAVVVLLTAGWSGTRSFRMLERLLSPLLSVPHAAAAFGLAFLIAPSGWFARISSPTLTGWDRPPDLLIVQDPMGFSLMTGLIVKEIPFLLLMALAALAQADATRSQIVAQSLGYGRLSGWLKVVFPSVYQQIRLPVYVVLAYAMSVVDVALILGPTTPPTLSVQIVKWMHDPDLSMRMVAAAGALVQLGLVLGALIIWRGGEVIFARIGERWVAAGNRSQHDQVLRVIGLGLGGAAAVSVLLGLLLLAIWSVAGFWGFPNSLPDTFNLRTWLRHGDAALSITGTTALIALVTIFLALFITIACLEAEQRRGITINQKGLALLYLPLIVPQTAFLPGLQTLLLGVGAEGGLLPVIFVHLVFVLPYVFLSLGDPFRQWDQRYVTVASALGASEDGVLWRVRLPMLVRPVLTAVAVGIAVSVAQYLPTLLIGGGRVSTLTTEAVALSSGGDRRAIGLFGLLQTAAAFLPFLLALLIPALLWRNRQGLQNG